MAIIFIFALILQACSINFPISFTVVRNINPPLSLNSFFQKVGCCSSDAQTGITNSYNIVSLDGFQSTSTVSSIQSGSSPLSIWVNAYSSITGSKDSIAGNTTSNVQKHILKTFHESSSYLILNALSLEAPISASNSSATQVATNLIKVLSATQLDGVSI